MPSLIQKIPAASLAAFALLLLAMGVVSLHMSTATMFAVSVLMLLTCGLNAAHLLGPRVALKFIGCALVIGFFAEFMGENYGWFFGKYVFTDALGPRLLGVPIVIPMMWFNICHICFVLGNLILHRAPRPPDGNVGTMLASAFFSAALVTAYDLGADPYMVFVAKAWVMEKTSGWWFTETLQGFVGWMTVSFIIISLLHRLNKNRAAAPFASFKKIHALIPVMIYANLMIFQMLYGFPVETRTIALFAMGLPLMMALFSIGYWSWDENQAKRTALYENRLTRQALEHAKFQGDTPADDAVAQLFASTADTPQAQMDGHGQQIQQIFALLNQLQNNADLSRHANPPTDAGATASQAHSALQPLLRQMQTLPPWADSSQITRAEQLFKDSGVISSILFFCASLPEVYVIPDISSALHATGNLEKMTEQRIRTTSAMILSVLLPGGIVQAQGAGCAKVFKARMIHAIMRHLFLRTHPHQVADGASIAVVAPLARSGPPGNAFEMAFFHGWNPANDGVPCNQEELAYTLLTFGFVYLRSLRRLGLRYAQPDEEAYLHCWNVIGHMLGIHEALMAHTMKEAAALFQHLQQRARARQFSHDTRPFLGAALANSIEKSISFRPLKPIACLLLQYLSSETTAHELGLDQRIGLLPRALFFCLVQSVKTTDAAIRLYRKDFSLARFILRVAGYQLINKLLTDQENPIELPDAIRQQINLMLQQWSHDPCAPDWMNRLEDYFTTQGNWNETIGV